MSSPAAEPGAGPAVAVVPQACPQCGKEYPCLRTLNKHAKSHTRPYKCEVVGCKYYTFGYPTSKDLRQHVHDKHSSAPMTFACAFPLCTYESNRESNCKQHMKKKHVWNYVRSASNGKRLIPQKPPTTLPRIGPIALQTNIPNTNITSSSLQTASTSYEPSSEPPFSPDLVRFPDDADQPIILGQPGENLGRSYEVTEDDESRFFIPWASFTTPMPKNQSMLDMFTETYNRATGKGLGHPDSKIDPSLPQYDQSPRPGYQHLDGHRLSAMSSPVKADPPGLAIDQYSWNGGSDTGSAPLDSPSDGRREASTAYSLQFHTPHSAGLEYTGLAAQPGQMGWNQQPNLRRRGSGDDDGHHPEKKLKPNNMAAFNDSAMPDIFQFAHPQIYDVNQNERYSPCHAIHREISTLVRHLSRPSHRLMVTSEGISSFDIEDEDYPHPRVGVCRRCWRQFFQRDSFNEHTLNACERVSKGKREKWQLLFESFTPLVNPSTNPDKLDQEPRGAERAEAREALPRSPSRQNGSIAPGVEGTVWDEPMSPTSVPPATPFFAQPAAATNTTHESVTIPIEEYEQSAPSDRETLVQHMGSQPPEADIDGLIYGLWPALDGDRESVHSIRESETSDLESIMSVAPSIASSQSSIPISINLGAMHELRSLLLTNESLSPLYEVAISKVGPEKFYRNLRRLLLQYGRALNTEATSALQVKAARFVRFSASRVSMQIKESVAKRVVIQQDRGKLSAKALGDYLKEIQDVDDLGDDDDSDHDPEEASLQTLDSVKSFMLSSKAFSDLCRSLRVWLGLESQGGQPDVLTAIMDQHSVLSQEKTLEVVASSHTIAGQALLSSEDLRDPPVREKRGGAWEVAWCWFPAVIAVKKRCWNRISVLWQPNPPPGQVRLSWTCRCGDILGIQVPESQQRTAINFARQAADPDAGTITSQCSTGTTQIPFNTPPATTNTTPQSPSRPARTQSSSNISSTTDTTTDSSSTGATSNCAGSQPESPNTVSSDEELGQPELFLPVGTKKYMLLCVNTFSPRGIPQRKLANVDVTDLECGAEVFQRLRTAYYGLRGSRRSAFFIPKSMHYVKFELLFLQKSGERVGAYEVDSIPSRKEVLKQEYAFSPCPPRIGRLPLPPDIFMHMFLNPGDHLGPMTVNILPKKLWCQLRWDAQANDRFNVPTGWGFYIVESINWQLVSLCTVVALVGVTLLTISWSVWAGDVQGGTGLGQYCLGVLTLSVSVWLLKYSVREGL